MTKYHIGVKAGAHTINLVVLQDGEFHSCASRDLTKDYEAEPRLRGDRGWQLNELHCYLGEFIEMQGELTEDNVSIIVEAADYGLWFTAQRALVEQSQTIGAIMALPYVVHEVASTTWKAAIVGKGGVTRSDTQKVVDGRFGLAERFQSEPQWYDAFCLARFGYVKDE